MYKTFKCEGKSKKCNIFLMKNYYFFNTKLYKINNILHTTSTFYLNDRKTGEI